MKKVFLTILLLTMLSQVAYFPSAAINNANPFENELFEVVTEVQYVRALGNFKNGLSRCYFDEQEVVEYVDYQGRLVFDAAAASESAAYLTLDGNFNDGVKIGQNAEDRWVYMDVNTTEISPVPLGYGDYNIGYFSSISSNLTNGGVAFTTTISSLTDDTSYTFFNAYIPVFDDNGYSIMNLNDANGNPAGSYVIRAKKHLIPTVQLDGIKIRFDQIPVIENGRTLVPLRGIFEALGARVDWNGATQTITAVKAGTEVSLTINSETALKNGETIILDVPAKVINGRTLVPVRFIADCFSIKVDWVDQSRTVMLSSK